MFLRCMLLGILIVIKTLVQNVRGDSCHGIKIVNKIRADSVVCALLMGNVDPISNCLLRIFSALIISNLL